MPAIVNVLYGTLGKREARQILLSLRNGLATLGSPIDLEIPQGLITKRENAQEDGVLLANRFERSKRNRRIDVVAGYWPVRKRCAKLDKLLRVVNRQGAQHQRIDQAENRCIRANAECQRNDGD